LMPTARPARGVGGGALLGPEETGPTPSCPRVPSVSLCAAGGWGSRPGGVGWGLVVSSVAGPHPQTYRLLVAASGLLGSSRGVGCGGGGVRCLGGCGVVVGCLRTG